MTKAAMRECDTSFHTHTGSIIHSREVTFPSLAKGLDLVGYPSQLVHQFGHLCF